MATRFAGSRQLDERRRRRLATENDETGSPPRYVAPPANSARFAPAPPSHERDDQPAGLPFPKLVSPRIWKHLFIGAVAFVAGGGILWTGSQQTALGHAGGPGLVRLFNLTDSPAVACYNSALLLLAAQLALLIRWVRSQSLHDFGGRYTIWGWAALSLLVFAGSIATNAHLAFSESIHWRWQLGFERSETLVWLIPAVTMGAALFWLLERDMRGSRLSRYLLWTAGFSFVGAIILQLAPVEIADAHKQRLFKTGASMMGHWAVFLSLLVHARHVIYQTAEPPELAAGLLTRTWRKLRALLKRKRRDIDDEPPQNAASATTEAASKAATKSVPAKKGAAKDVTSPNEAAKSETRAAQESAAQQKPAAKTARPKKKPTAKKKKTTKAVAAQVSDPSAEEANNNCLPDEGLPDEGLTAESLTAEDPTAKRSTAKNSSSKKATTKSPPVEEDLVETTTRQTSRRDRPAAKKSARSARNQEASDNSAKDEDTTQNDAINEDSTKEPLIMRTDGPQEKPDLKGLSKRERRMALKQWREEQRAAGH